jgi:hypothetical protein
MWRYRTEVDLALSRPPRADVTVYGVVLAETNTEAQLVATLMAMSFHPGCVMPVASRSADLEFEEA